GQKKLWSTQDCLPPVELFSIEKHPQMTSWLCCIILRKARLIQYDGFRNLFFNENVESSAYKGEENNFVIDYSTV
ncbi:hypothetical protein PFISCL1PPCAC_16941, partial [Pristionchus fissidentatus]